MKTRKQLKPSITVSAVSDPYYYENIETGQLRSDAPECLTTNLDTLLSYLLRPEEGENDDDADDSTSDDHN